MDAAKFIENGNLKVLLHLLGINWLALGIDTGGNHVRPLVHVGEQQGWADARLGMQP